MDNNNSLLSQEEVDALFKQATGKTVERSLAPAVEQPAAPAQVVEPLPADPAPRQQPLASIKASPPADEPAITIKAPAAKPGVTINAPPVKPAASRSAAPFVLKGPSPSPPLRPPLERQSVPGFSGTPLPVDLEDITDSLVGISQRLSSLENRLERLERIRPQAAVQPAPALQEKVHRLAQQVRMLTSQMETIESGLKNTPDYNLRADFVCESCGAEGAITSRHRCSKCGREGWWGWWPRSNGKR